jgi:FlaA1/EpsC-like NDP-sugar epimerase
MGEPINIYELAKSMSLLAGFAPGRNCRLLCWLARRREKVTEELWIGKFLATPQKGILMIPDRDPNAVVILQKSPQWRAIQREDRMALTNLFVNCFPSRNKLLANKWNNHTPQRTATRRPRR